MAFQPKLTWLGLLVLVATAAQAQKLPAPLVDAAKTAVLSSPDVQERWKAFRAAEQGPGIAASQWKPRADLTASVGREWRSNVVGAETNLNTRGAELSLSQLLFDGGVASASVRQASRQKVEAYRNRPLPDTFPAGTHTHADLSAFADFLINRPGGAR